MTMISQELKEMDLGMPQIKKNYWISQINLIKKYTKNQYKAVLFLNTYFIY